MTKRIPLTQGKFALVDDDDYARVSQYKWCVKRLGNTEYATRCIYTPEKETTQLLHRVILNAKSGTIIDHINSNGLDCRKSNLRFCSTRQNAQHNRGYGKTPYKGVSKKLKYEATIHANGKGHYLGIYSTAEEAARAYDAAARKFFGEFALLNFPD